ncbi:LysR family transcriptional regulator [Streptomyces anulatus]|uniref:LysR family transcriptional regulator n=1 Tax=Streptomyces anulatus TaxID=1892 RepID=UPI003644DDA8
MDSSLGSKAAQLLHLAQSAVARKILGLEEELGVAAPPEAGPRPDRPVNLRDALRRPFIVSVPRHGMRTLLDQARAEAPVEPNVIV